MLTKSEFRRVVEKYDLDDTGIPRSYYMKRLQSSLERKEILVLKGIRRCGKSTIQKQLIKKLLADGVETDCILYVNFDDFEFIPYLNLELLEFIQDQLPKGKKTYLFLDEIQKIPQFESWLRTQYERGVKTKYVISGSNVSLLSKGLATVLTGRTLTYTIYPLNYTEYKDFSSDSFDNFLEFGGFPEIVLAKSLSDKTDLLKNYVNDIIHKDIFSTHDIPDKKQFYYFVQYFLSNPGLRVSLNKLSKTLGLGKNTAKDYISYMIDAYLIFEVPFFSYSAKAKFSALKVSKYYITDLGFYRVNSPRYEKSKVFETIVAQKFYAQEKDVFYWKGKNEVDFVFEKDVFNVVSSDTIPEREFKGLVEIHSEKKHLGKSFLITPSLNETGDITFVSLDTFLLN